MRQPGAARIPLRVLVAAASAAVEATLASRYADFGALFHYWLHGLTGVAVGLALLAVAGLVRRSPPTAGQVVLAAALGRVLLAAPDVLFVAASLPHERWMDVFGGHITVHLVPAPLLVAYATFVLGVAAATLTFTGRRRAGGAAGLATVTVLVAALALASPLPTSLDDVRSDPDLALRCALPAG